MPGGLSATVGALGIDEAGDTLLFANFVCPANYGLAYAADGGSTHCLDDLILDGGRSFLSFASKGAASAGALDASKPNVGIVAALVYNFAAGTYRLAKLIPAGDLPTPPMVALAATPHPGTWVQPFDAITLSWRSGGYLAKAYSIERNRGGRTFTEIARIGATVTQYNDQVITPLTTYAYRVAAIGLAGAGPYLNEAAAQAPPAMDRTAPLVTIASPADGATVTGVVSISATFTDNVGLTCASFAFSPSTNGGIICSSSPAAPTTPLRLSCKWDTRKTGNQSPTATLVAYGYDAIGNWVQASVNVDVSYSTKGGGKGR